MGRKEDRPDKGTHKSVGRQRPHEQVTGQMGPHVSAGWAGGDGESLRWTKNEDHGSGDFIFFVFLCFLFSIPKSIQMQF